MAIKRKDNIAGASSKSLRNTAAAPQNMPGWHHRDPRGRTWQGWRKGKYWAVRGEEPQESGRQAGSPVFCTLSVLERKESSWGQMRSVQERPEIIEEASPAIPALQQGHKLLSAQAFLGLAPKGTFAWKRRAAGWKSAL